MIKKQQKWIALFVALTFVWLLQVSTMPVSAAGSSEQLSSASAEQGPNFIEGEGHASPRNKKKSALPWILIGVGVVGVTVALYFFVLKTKYDIRGDWNIIRTANNVPYSFTTKFIGEKASGTFDAMQSGSLLHGTYTTDGKDVSWIFESGSEYTGSFTEKDAMSGAYLKYDGVTTGTWTATRTAAAATIPGNQTQKGELDKK